VFIAIAVTIAMLYFGRLIFIPLALALVISFLLSPIVDLLERIHVGRAPSVMTVLALCFVLAAGVGWEITGQTLDITGHLGDYKENLEQTIHSLHPPSTIGQATTTVRELNSELAAAPGKVSNSSPDSKARPSKPVAVQVTAPPTNLLQDVRALLGPVAEPLETAGKEDVRSQDCNIRSRASLLQMVSVEPFTCSHCFFLKSENNRLTVSRVVPIISAISSCVSVILICDVFAASFESGDHESNNFANFSAGEVVRPRVRISS